ncbi:MAG: urease accessory protein UreE [Roseimicrobium sp.]
MLLVQRMVAEFSDRSATEQVRLLAERRVFLKRRWRGVAEDGTEFGFDLESRLSNGCVIHRADHADYVVWQEPELVYEVLLETPAQAALVGWKIGNLHLPVEVTERSVRAIHDPAMPQLCDREGWAFTEQTVVFNPLRVTAHAP